MQEEWRKIGRAPRKDNESIYQRFRAGIDAFFRRRNDFFKANHEHTEEILQKKRALIERAAALKDSTAWEETTNALKALQKEWQELGAVSPKYSQKIWEEFRASFDYFFDRKKKEAPRRDKAYSEARKSLGSSRNLRLSMKAKYQRISVTCSIATTNAGSRLASSPTRIVRPSMQLIVSCSTLCMASCAVIVRSVVSRAIALH